MSKKTNEPQGQIEAEFDRREAELAAANPGVLDILRVYGEYETALHQAEAYLAAMKPAPRFSTSNTSGP